MAMAEGTDLWVRAMANFLADIPSLCKAPGWNNSRVFFEPEQKLQGVYSSQRGILRVTGCYDALLFNPDRAEATLFEFKGYRRTEVTGPLSQALVYAWLVREATGVLPAVQVIYLEEAETDAFTPADVQKMTTALPAMWIGEAPLRLKTRPPREGASGGQLSPDTIRRPWRA